MLRAISKIGPGFAIKQDGCHKTTVLLYLTRNINDSVSNKVPEHASGNAHIILDKVNNSSAYELTKGYCISTKLAEVLESCRLSHGPYKSLEEILEVTAMSPKSLDIFCKSVIDNKLKRMWKAKEKSLMFPSITYDKCQRINTILGVYVGPNSVSWTLLDRDFNVHKWECQNFQFPSKCDLMDVVTWVHTSVNLPPADIYLMERIKSFTVRSKKEVMDQLRRIQLSSIIMSRLLLNDNERRNENEHSKVYTVQRNTIAELFGLEIGKEIIATDAIVASLIQEKRDSDTNHLPFVRTAPDLCLAYEKSIPSVKEQMNWSLLLSLAFLDLIVLQRYESYWKFFEKK